MSLHAETVKQLLLEAGIFLEDLRALTGLAHRHQDLLLVEGLGQVVEGSLVHRLDRRIDGAVGGHDDHRRRYGLGGKGIEQLDAIHPRHLQIGNNHIRRHLADGRQSLTAGSGGQVSYPSPSRIVCKIPRCSGSSSTTRIPPVSSSHLPPADTALTSLPSPGAGKTDLAAMVFDDFRVSASPSPSPPVWWKRAGSKTLSSPWRSTPSRCRRRPASPVPARAARTVSVPPAGMASNALMIMIVQAGLDEFGIDRQFGQLGQDLLPGEPSHRPRLRPVPEHRRSGTDAANTGAARKDGRIRENSRQSG